MRFHLFFVFDAIGAQKRCFIEYKIVNRSFLFWDNIPIKKGREIIRCLFISEFEKIISCCYSQCLARSCRL